MFMSYDHQMIKDDWVGFALFPISSEAHRGVLEVDQGKEL
jgi:hypothetical protein